MGTKLIEILDGVKRGEYVVPDFQRSFVWGPENIKELLVSILDDYYIGSFLIWETKKEDCPFKTRPVEGVEKETKGDTIKAIMDGQQRISSLYYALTPNDRPVPERKSPAKFFLNIDHVCDKNISEAVVYSLTSRKKLKEYQNTKEYIPFTALGEFKRTMQFLEDNAIDKAKYGPILEASMKIPHCEVYVSPLPRGATLQRIVETFERVNRYGKPLSQYDLIEANLYKQKVKLSEYEKQAKKKYHWWPTETKDSNETVLTVLKIMLLSGKKTLDKESLLKFQAATFPENWTDALNSLDKAHSRLKSDYGVFDERRWMPTPPMLLPLAVLLGMAKAANDYKKIDSWYWNAVFSERYREAANTRAVSDVESMEKWFVSGKPEDAPDFFDEYDFGATDFDNITKGSLYRGIMCVYSKEGCLDFETGQKKEFLPNRVQDDHVFPETHYHDDSILNRTLISTNQIKNDKHPKEYFGNLEKAMSKENLANILITHLISPNGLNALLGNKLKEFKEERKKILISKVNTLVETP